LMEARINNELLPNFSNLCYRAMSIIASKAYGGKIEKINRIKDGAIIKDLEDKYKNVFQHFERRDFRAVIYEILEVSAIGNKYLQDKEPWKNKAEAPTTLALCVNMIKNLSILFYPIMPGLCENLRRQLNVPQNLMLKDINFDLEDHMIGKPEMLVTRIEPDTNNPEIPNASTKTEETKQTKQPQKKQTPPSEANTAMDISRLDIRVGKILSVKKHESADSLYVEQIDIGEDKPRQVVSGLVKYVPIEEMQDREVVLLCNLKAANLKSVRSEAMVLCANNEDGTKVELLTPPKGCKIGERIITDGFPGAADATLNPKHKVWETVQPELKTNSENVVCYKGIPLKTSVGVCTVSTIANGSIK